MTDHAAAPPPYLQAGESLPAIGARIRWRRRWDGALFTGTVLAHLPEHHSVTARPDDRPVQVSTTVHLTNIQRATP